MGHTSSSTAAHCVSSIECLTNMQLRYRVQDSEPDEDGADGKIYKTPATNLIAITPRNQFMKTEYPIGKRVLARYPHTTGFFPATVKDSSEERRLYMLNFDSDNDRVVEVDARFVPRLPIPSRALSIGTLRKLGIGAAGPQWLRHRQLKGF